MEVQWPSISQYTFPIPLGFVTIARAARENLVSFVPPECCEILIFRDISIFFMCFPETESNC